MERKFGLIHGWGAPWLIAVRVKNYFSDVDVIVFGRSTFAITMNFCFHVSPGMQKQAVNLLEKTVIGASKDDSVTIVC